MKFVTSIFSSKHLFSFTCFTVHLLPRIIIQKMSNYKQTSVISIVKLYHFYFHYKIQICFFFLDLIGLWKWQQWAARYKEKKEGIRFPMVHIRHYRQPLRRTFMHGQFTGEFSNLFEINVLLVFENFTNGGRI